MAAEAEREQTVNSIMAAGDGRAIEVLREEWAGRDLDGVRAGVDQIRMDVERTDGDIETAFTNLQELRRELFPHLTVHDKIRYRAPSPA